MKKYRRRLLLPWLGALLLLLCCGIGSVAAATVSVSLTARQVDRTMPDGTVVPVWVFEDAAQPGVYPPVIRATAGDTLDINLTNALPATAGVGEPVSVMIRGQKIASPQWVTTSGQVLTSRPAGDLTSRVRSMAPEVAVGQGPVTYSWSGLRAGTYLVESASHMSVQGPMGLYALLVVDEATAGQAYGQSFDVEQVMVLSDIDVPFHQAKATGVYGTPAYPNIMSVGYEPHYFLLNGEPFSPARSPLGSVAPGQKVLLRCANASIRTRVLATNVAGLQVLAEDGFAYPMVQPSGIIDLPPGKTLDILFTAPSTPGYLVFYDRRLGLANGTEGPGGFMAFLTVGTPNRTLTAVIDGAGTGSGRIELASAPGGIDCGPGGTTAACSESLLDSVQVTLRATPASIDQALSGWTVTDANGPTGECAGLGDCVVTMSADKTVTARFDSYSALTLLSPGQNTVLPADSIYTIRWGAPADAVSFRILYRLGPGFPWVIEAREVTGRSYQWPIPSFVRTYGRVRLAVVGYRADGTQVGVATSDTTLAIQDSLTLIQPNGGEQLTPGQAYSIQWDTTNVAGQVASTGLWYQAGVGTAWYAIASLAGDGTGGSGNLGSYSWTVPTGLASSQVRVLIRFFDAAGRVLLTDTSDHPFTIGTVGTLAGDRVVAAGGTLQLSSEAASRPATLALLAPNGGEVVPQGGFFTVFWQALPEAATYGIELSLDGGQSWRELARDLPDNQFDWTVGTDLAPSEQARLRVTAYDALGKKLASDLTDAVFAIQ